MLQCLHRFLLLFVVLAPTSIATPLQPTNSVIVPLTITPAPTGAVGQALKAGQWFMLQKADKTGWLGITAGANNAGTVVTSQAAAAIFQIAGTAGTAVTYARSSSGANGGYGAFSLQTHNNGNYISITDSTVVLPHKTISTGYTRNNVVSDPSIWETLFFKPNQVVTNTNVTSVEKTAVTFGDTVYIGRGTGRNRFSIWIQINSQKQVITYSNEVDTGGMYSIAHATAFTITPTPPST